MKPVKPRDKQSRTASAAAAEQEERFAEVVRMIQVAREQTLAAVNTALIDLYWQVGKTISARIASDGWGKGTVTALASYIQSRQPGLRGFSPQNLWRMRQFFDTYRDQAELSTLLRELPWSSHLHILAKTKHPEEREFYLRMSSQHGGQCGK